eukprot:m.383061 g.383061  ORF g.383061 m.383061 type:complete len:307 (-) comp20979_c0_seq5:185-1105(-)
MIEEVFAAQGFGFGLVQSQYGFPSDLRESSSPSGGDSQTDDAFKISTRSDLDNSIGSFGFDADVVASLEDSFSGFGSIEANDGFGTVERKISYGSKENFTGQAVSSPIGRLGTPAAMPSPPRRRRSSGRTFKSPKVLSPRNRRNSAAKSTAPLQSTFVPAVTRDLLQRSALTPTQVLQPSPSVARYAGDRSGWLRIKKATNKKAAGVGLRSAKIAYKELFFRLTDGILTFHDSPAAPAHAEVNIFYNQGIDYVMETSCFSITMAHKKFYFAAKSASECEGWVRTLRATACAAFRIGSANAMNALAY